MKTSAYSTEPSDDLPRLLIAFAISLALHLLLIFGFQVGSVEHSARARAATLRGRLAPLPAAEGSAVLVKSIDRPVNSQVPDYVPPGDAHNGDASAGDAKRGLPEAAGSPTLLDVPAPPDTTYYPLAQVDEGPRHLGDPEYPEQAAQLGVGGRVKVHLLVNELGGVDEATVISVDPPDWGFETEVLNYLKAHRFTPAIRKGRAVRSEMVYEIEFAIGAPVAEPPKK